MTEVTPPWRSDDRLQPAAPDASRELDDPTTSAERLQQIAFEHPEMGPRIAAHPNCYPELREWVERHAQAAMAHRSSRPSTEPASRSRRLLRAFGVAAAIVLPLITAVSIAIPLLASLGERQSAPETLKISTVSDPLAEAEVIGEVTPATTIERERVIDWEIPVSAPIEDFPLDNTPDEQGQYSGCSPAQLDWLEKHAVPGNGSGSPAFSMTLHNSSTTGASLPLGNIRFVGEEVESDVLVRFICPSGGRGATAGGQPLLIKVTGEESLYGEAVNVSGDDVMPEGSPVTLNLAPGEVSVVTLTRDASVDTQKRYEGRFVADLIDSADSEVRGTQVVLADEVAFKRAAMPDFYVGFRSGQLSNEFVCLSPTVSGGTNSWGAPQPVPCTRSQAAEILREARTFAEK